MGRKSRKNRNKKSYNYKNNQFDAYQYNNNYTNSGPEPMIPRPTLDELIDQYLEGKITVCQIIDSDFIIVNESKLEQRILD